MKSWADSDDEDEHLGPDDDDSLPVQNKVEDPPATGPEPADGEKPRRHLKKDFVWPETPPYTAFVGNLAFSIKNPDELGEKIFDLVKERFGADIVISNVRVAMDRHTGKQKGFGYVEVETLEQLKAVLQLNDGQSVIAGRTIHLDVAQPPAARSGSFGARSSSLSEIDGSRFQGGRHSSKKGSFRRQNSTPNDEDGAPPAQRASLKLQPRSKDRESSEKASSSLTIFGSGKARDGGEWERKRSSVKDDEAPKDGQFHERRSSRGGVRGGRGGGRGGGGGRGQNNNRQSSAGNRGGSSSNSTANNNNNNNNNNNSSSSSRKADQSDNKDEQTPRRFAQQAPEAEKAANQEPKKVANKFAALDLDDSDED